MIREDCSKIGYIAKPHGIAGNIILRLNGNFADEIEPGEPLFVEFDGTLVPFFIEEITPQENRAIVKLEFINSEPEASKLSSKSVFSPLRVSEISLDNASLFESFSINDKNSGKEGEILEYIPDELNPLFKTVFNEKEFLIPVLSDFILDIDKENKIISTPYPNFLNPFQAKFS